MELTDEQWAVLEPLIPEQERQPSGPGRPWRAARDVMHGSLWVLRTGARWQDLPDRYPAYHTCQRRCHQWVDAGVFDQLLQASAGDLLERGQLARSACCIDGTCGVANKGAATWERPSAGTLWVKVRSAWHLQTALVCLSPSTLTLLHRMRSPLVRRLSPRVALMTKLNG